MTPQQYSSYELEFQPKSHKIWTQLIGSYLFPLVQALGSHFQIFLSATRTLFLLIILNKAVILLHSHMPWGTQTLYKLPSIMGPVTATTDAGNAVTGFTIKVRKVTLVIRSVCQGRSLCFMFWCINPMYWNKTRKVGMDLRLGGCKQNLALPEHCFCVVNTLRKIFSTG